MDVDVNIDMDEPRRLAKSKTPEQIKAITPAGPKFMEYLQDERFAEGRVWQLNL